MSIKEQSDIRRKLKVLNHAKETGNISKTCRHFGISREAIKWRVLSTTFFNKASTDISFVLHKNTFLTSGKIFAFTSKI